MIAPIRNGISQLRLRLFATTACMLCLTAATTLLLVVACKGGNIWGVDELRDPDRQGALYAWDLTREAALDVPRYAFYPQAGLTYTELSARAFRPETAFAYAQRNERSQLASMFDDTELTVYVTEHGHRFSGEQWKAIRAEQDPEYTFRGASNNNNNNNNNNRTDKPERNNAADTNRQPPRRLPRPSRVVGTLLMFANQETAMAIAVYEDPKDRRGHWYFAIDGLRGDRAYYRLGETSRIYLQVATRNLSRATGR